MCRQSLAVCGRAERNSSPQVFLGVASLGFCPGPDTSTGPTLQKSQDARDQLQPSGRVLLGTRVLKTHSEVVIRV